MRSRKSCPSKYHLHSRRVGEAKRNPPHIPISRNVGGFRFASPTLPLRTRAKRPDGGRFGAFVVCEARRLREFLFLLLFGFGNHADFEFRREVLRRDLVERDLGVLIVAASRAGRDEVSDDHVFLETAQ